MATVRDRLLGPLYWFRRAFLLRTRRFRLLDSRDGWRRVDDSTMLLPHGAVRLRLHPANWASVELRGQGGRDAPRGGWHLWLERPVPSGELALELPFALRNLEVKLHPGSISPGESLELAEVGVAKRVIALARERIARGLAPPRLPRGDYRRWLSSFDTLSRASRQLLAERALSSRLRGALLLDAGAPDGPSPPPGAPADVQVVRRLEDVEADFVVTLPAGATLAEHAFDTIACAFAENPQAQVVHGDDDLGGPSGPRRSPSFKPSFSPELLRSRNYLDGLVAYRRSALPVARRGTLDRAGRYRLLLEVSSAAPGSIHRVPAVLASLPRREGDGPEERNALSEHLTGIGVPCEIVDGLLPGLRHVRYRPPDRPPRVSIIVPTRNARQLVQVCVRSVRRLTAYPGFEILLVDNGSDEPESLAAFDALQQEGLIRLSRDPRAFNYAALNNRAVSEVSSELVCLMNNDVEALHPDWLEEMVGVAMQPGVGAVGAKLLYPDGRIQHGGVLVGYLGVAGHLYSGAPGDAPGMDAQLMVRREVSAVTAACLVVRRDLYQRVGGLDEQAFSVGYNDVDFCLRLQRLGFRNIWTPHARLLHHESATRGRPTTPADHARLARETEILQARWGTSSLEDPFHSPNLSVDSLTPALAVPPRRRPWAVGCAS